VHELARNPAALASTSASPRAARSVSRAGSSSHIATPEHRLGSGQALPVWVPLIFASHQRLHDEVRAGGFRMGPQQRIDADHLRVPPLRERPEEGS